jgi:Acyl-CoA dehydrogenase, C-terminal domain
VADLDDATRAKRLAGAVRDAGWLELRSDGGEGGPLASGVEVGIVADALGASVADVAFSGPVLAADLGRRAGVSDGDAAVVAFPPSLADVAAVAGSTTGTPLYAVDGAREGVDAAYVLVPGGSRSRLGLVPLDGAERSATNGSDLTRSIQVIGAGASVDLTPGTTKPLTDDDLIAWTALGLALASADLVGVMRGVLDITVAYAAERRQYGVPVGSFQAVQHLLAEARCLVEGSHSVALHASWAVDNLTPHEARAAGRVAKAYCARAARTVCETAVQVHGGIGNTWECMVHVYLRRALLSTQWFGDDGEQLRELGRERLGMTDGLS